MRTETALNHRYRATSQINDLWSHAKIFGHTSETITDKFVDIIESLEKKKVPYWVISYIRGYHDCLWAMAYRHDLVHGAWLLDGEFYSTHSNRDDYYEKNGLSPADFHRLTQIPRVAKTLGHHWIMPKGKDPKPFFCKTEEETEQ